MDEGVAEMRNILAQPPAAGRNRYEQGSKAAMALTLAKIGRLTGKTNLLEDGIRLTRQELSKNGDSANYGESSTATQLAGFLVDIGRGPDAEAVLSDDLLVLLHSSVCLPH